MVSVGTPCVGLRSREFVGGIEERYLPDPKAHTILGEEIGDRLRPDGRDRVGHQRDIGIIPGKEAGPGSGLVEQEHLVIARDRHRRRGQYRAGIGYQEIDLVLRDKLIVQRRCGRGVALIVVGDKLDRDLLVERLHIGPALGIFLVGPEFKRAENRHRNRGIASG